MEVGPGEKLILKQMSVQGILFMDMYAETVTKLSY